MRNLLRIAVLLVTASFAFAQAPTLTPSSASAQAPALALRIASAQRSKIAPDLARIDTRSKVNVIVQFKHVPTEAQHMKVRNQGGRLTMRLGRVKAGLYSVPASALATLANDPEVAYISPDRKLKGKLDLTAEAVNAAAAWLLNLDGTGIGVAVIDSGISDHPDLANSSGASRVVYSQDFTGSGTADDQYGHGEHVAGIVAGNGASSTCPTCTRTLMGMAPNVSLINLRVLDENGSGTDSEVIAAIDQAIALASIYNIRVINLSLGRGVYESYTQDPLCQAVEAAWQAGIVVVVAAGNEGRDNSVGENGYGTVTAPGNDPFVITVGSMKDMGTADRSDDLIGSYSSKGPTGVDHVVKPDIVAPGNLTASLLANINDTIPTNEPATLIPNTYYDSAGDGSTSSVYYTLSGTSMATPVVSGAVALLLQQNPSLTPDQVKARLMRTAYKTFPTSSEATDLNTGDVYTSYYDIFTIGAGYLDIAAALADTTPFTGTANSPTAVFDPTSGTAQVYCASSDICANQSLWATQSIWAASVFVNGTQSLWGAQSVFGTQSIWATQSVWATQSLWATNSNSAESTDSASSIMVHGEK
jgi:serine protease AprX